MKPLASFLAVSLAGSVAAQGSYGSQQSGQAGQVTYSNTRRLLFDTDGNQIDAYGSKVNLFNGSYYLYGNSFSTTGPALGIKSYSSIDLENWQYNGFLFDPSPNNTNNPCKPALGGCGRPHIVYHTQTTQYILWANTGSVGYVVATSKSPSGPFVFLTERALIDPQFSALQPADFTVETFGSKGYLVFSALNFRDPRAGSIWPPIFQTLHISELTSDLKNTTQVSYPVKSAELDLIDEEAESPDLFMRNGGYYVSASNTCGYYNGSIGLLYRSRSIKGPWTRQIIAGYSCEGQVEGVLPLTDPKTQQTSFVWHSTSVPAFEVNADGSVQELDCSVQAKFSVPFPLGISNAGKSGNALSAGDSSPRDAVYTPVCDSDSFDLYQTWTASKSGTLKSVSVNIARARQEIPLSLTVYKFSSYNDMIQPEYKWTTLGTISTNATDLKYTFDVATVPVTSNATVKVGDLLGIAMTGQDFSPYCHLEYDASADSKKVLYQRGAGQNSWRGLEGTTSILYKRAGKGVKFFSTYA
ncbi:Putative glycoside hydrolase, family 43 [Septoria linicola]|uniref:Glycoside hydrolase, family 43 n=1 Tax=Septoria linicola TaxID=215465 RepID=A0A9Q9ARB0_9PEZI|nr:Putative glycoside hydrolase, family 43 [Septoria linicola]